MEKKCRGCYYYRTLLGVEYCQYDVQTDWWEERRKKYEFMCDRFLSKKASFEEQNKYLRNRHEKLVKLDKWEEPKEEEDEFIRENYSPSEIYRMKQEKKISVSNRSEFIDKYPILNPSPPKK